MKIKRVLFIILTISIFFTFPGPVQPETAQEAVTDSGTSGRIIIRKSENFYLDNKEGTTVFSNVEITFLSGEVKTRWDNMTLTCEKLMIYYETDPDVINRMVATGDVRISQPDGSLFTAEKAEYFHAEEKIYLTGDPVFKRDKNLLKGNILTIDLVLDTVSGENIEGDLVLDEESKSIVRTK